MRPVFAHGFVARRSRGLRACSLLAPRPARTPARLPRSGAAIAGSKEEVLVLELELHAAEVARRLLGVVGVVRARGVHVEEEAEDGALEEDGAAAAGGEEPVD